MYVLVMMMLTTYLFVLISHRAADFVRINKPRFIQTKIVVFLLNTTTLLKCDVFNVVTL